MGCTYQDEFKLVNSINTCSSVRFAQYTQNQINNQGAKLQKYLHFDRCILYNKFTAVMEKSVTDICINSTGITMKSNTAFSQLHTT